MLIDDVIWVVTEDEPQKPEEGMRGQQGRNPYEEPAYARGRGVPIKSSVLEDSMTTLLQQVGRVLSHAKQRAGELAGMELEEIELSVEISSEGQVSLLGSGVKAGGKGAMTLKFKATKLSTI